MVDNISPGASDFSEKNIKDYSLRIKIAHFFMRLYKLQINAEESAPSDILLITSESTFLKQVYELRVKHFDKWETRRMTVGPLGEEGGSKSKCFYVIFDIYLVIKIPIIKINSFDDYTGIIRKNRHVVTRLAPRECIVPNISVIFKKIHTFSMSEEMAEEHLEEAYITWLSENPVYQEYLKIAGTFVYFMDMSNYFFLSHILEDMNDKKVKVYEEITKNYEIIWEPDGFEGRYGYSDRNDITCMDIQNVFSKCESEIRHLIVRAGVSSTVLLYQMKKWFFIHVAGGLVEGHAKDLSSDFINELNVLINNIVTYNSGAVNAYRETVAQYVHRTSFAAKKIQVAGLIINILELLGWLWDKGVAMRDLKPDNLFVAGRQEAYPNFLRSPEDYALGLIDVETAAIFKWNDENMEQPQLGGTPFYATPSHLFPNGLLKRTFTDVKQILSFQDWYASIAMMYKVVTGETLFRQTGMLFPSMGMTFRTAIKKKKCLNEAVKHINRKFWESAVHEFRTKTKKNESILRTVMLVVPNQALEMFNKTGIIKQNDIHAAIEACITSQAFFNNRNARELLMNASPGKITQLKTKWESGNNIPSEMTSRKMKIINFLKELEQLKLQFRNSKIEISVYDLLSQMYNTVFSAMYKKEWGELRL